MMFKIAEVHWKYSAAIYKHLTKYYLRPIEQAHKL